MNLSSAMGPQRKPPGEALAWKWPSAATATELAEKNGRRRKNPAPLINQSWRKFMAGKGPRRPWGQAPLFRPLPLLSANSAARLSAAWFAACVCSTPAVHADVVIENRDVRLVLADDARVLSLRHLPSQTECLAPGTDVRAFSTLQHRGYGGDNGPRIVTASAVRREGDQLIVSFASLVSRAVIRLRISDAYLGFILEKIEGDASFAAGKARPAFFNEETLPFDELVFLQLPVKDRGRFGDWLNVAWDDRVAVNLLATDPFTRIDASSGAGCQRGALTTTPVAHVAGTIGGLLDVDNWPVFVRFNQRTDIQSEVAGRLGRLYAAAGFRFAYFDGSEDVHAPYWYNVPHAQWLVYRELQPAPLFCETSTLAHFNWHLMSRSTAEDPVPAEELKDFIRQQRIPEAAARALNFTKCNFGWIQFRPPGRTTHGMQPDIIEYATSRAAGWGCPISIIATLRDLEATPRNADNHEVQAAFAAEVEAAFAAAKSLSLPSARLPPQPPD